MLSIRIISHKEDSRPLPLYLYCIGSHNQTYLTRPDGFVAHQIFFTKSGHGVFRIFERQDIEVFPGTALIIPANVAHEYYPSGIEPWELSFLCIQGPLFKTLIDQLGFTYYKMMIVDNFNQIMELFYKLWKQSDFSSYNECIQSSTQLYEFLLQLSTTYHFESVENISKENDCCQKIAKYINSHYAEPLALSILAQSFDYSPQQLEWIFHKRYNVSLHSYLEKIRLQQAINLLHENKNIKIAQVAEFAGYETGYFIRLFKKKVGYTPKQYQRNPFLMEKSLFDFLK